MAPLDLDLAAHDSGNRDSAIRRKVTLVLIVEFVVLMAIASIEGFWPSAGPGAAAATFFLIGAMIIVPSVMALLARPILRDIRHLAEENGRLRELYGKARNRRPLDGLTGLGNHRAFQEELARQLEHGGRSGSALALLLIDVDDLKKRQRRERSRDR